MAAQRKTISGKAIAASGISPSNLREQIGMSAADFQAMGDMGAMFYSQGQLDKALTIFEGMLELEPENDAVLSALGAVLTQRREDERALICLDKAIEKNRSEIASFVNRAEILLRKSEFERAVEDLTEAINLDPQEKDPGANRARAMVLGIHQMIESKKAEEKARKAENNN